MQVAPGLGGVDRQEPCGLSDVKGLDEKTVGNAEHGRIRPDSQPQGEDSRHSEHGPFSERPNGELKVLNQTGSDVPPPCRGTTGEGFLRLFHDFLRVSETIQSLPQGFLRAKSSGLEVLHLHLEMKPDLLSHLLIQE